ncbi:hypothetical protein D3C73_1421720 [compost metagenome]
MHKSMVGLIDDPHSARHRFRSALHRLYRLADSGYHIGDENINLIRLPVGLIRQLTHLSGDDAEATAMLACPRRLNSSIQRQQIGLSGNGIDGPDNCRYLA